jgi:hypothetical protein
LNRHRERSVAIHDFALHGLPHFVRNDESGNTGCSWKAKRGNPWLLVTWIAGSGDGDF